MFTNPIGKMLSRSQVIMKLEDLPDLPIVVVGQLSNFGMVRKVEVITVREFQNGEICLLNDKIVAKYYFGEGALFDNWMNAKEIEVIAIVGI